MKTAVCFCYTTSLLPDIRGVACAAVGCFVMSFNRYCLCTVCCSAYTEKVVISHHVPVFLFSLFSYRKEGIHGFVSARFGFTKKRHTADGSVESVDFYCSSKEWSPMS